LPSPWIKHVNFTCRTLSRFGDSAEFPQNSFSSWLSNFGKSIDPKEDDMTVTTERLLLVPLFLFAALFSSLTARAADLQKTYQYDRADCMSGFTRTDKAACLREAGAALQEAKSGKLADANADFERNRTARCAYLNEPDRGYCLRRMNGEGTMSGSVDGGGILRELVVTVPE